MTTTEPTTELPSDLGGRLRRLREQRGMRIEEIAVLTDRSRQIVDRWETNRAAPRLVMLRKLAQIFDVSVGMLARRRRHRARR